MPTNHVYVLHAPYLSGEIRHVVHLCEDAEELQEHISGFLQSTGRDDPTAGQSLALAAGPHHPGFAAALAALKLQASQGCASQIVKRGIEMLIACEMLPPASEGDDVIMQALYGSFSTAEDWENFTHSSQLAALNLLIAHEMIDEPSDGDESIADRMLIVQLSSAICVAMVQARAELQRELTAQSADSDG